VTNKSLQSLTGGKIPQSEGLIPRSRDGVRTVLGDGNILNDVRVTGEGSLGNTVSLLVTGKVPDDQALITGSGQENVGVGARSGQRSDPTVVSLKGGTENKNFVTHFCVGGGNVYRKTTKKRRRGKGK